MRCPKGYIQKPAKSGNCVKKTASVTQKKKRCPKGSRKNKLGECEKIDKQNFSKKKSHSKSKSKSPKSTMNAKFYNVANDIFPGHSEEGYILPKYKKQKKEMVQKYVDKESKLNPGDILFVGSTNDTRYYEGAFVIFSNERTAIGYGDNAVSLPMYYRTEIPEKISYKALLDNEFDNLGEAKPDSEEYEFGMEFFGVAPGEDFKTTWQDVINDYESYGIY
jgi:hypothetical protein